MARAKVYVNRVATTTANEWKDDADKLMPVKRWLEERRLLQVQKKGSEHIHNAAAIPLPEVKYVISIIQGEIQRLRDKIAIAERSAKVEAQLNVRNSA